MDDKRLEELVRDTIRQVLREGGKAGGVMGKKLPQIPVREEDRLDTGNPGDRVYTRDLFSRAESPRLGCGIMEMEKNDFPWTLNYDEVDYVISGKLTVCCGGERVSAGEGELIYIPKGSTIRFRAEEKTRFLYVTYPADWQNS